MTELLTTAQVQPLPPLRRLLKRLLKAYTPEIIRQATIRRWALQENVPVTLLARGRATAPFLEAGEPEAVAEVMQLLAASVPHLSLKTLEGIFEGLLGDQQRTGQGAVYTPRPIIDYILQTTWQLAGRPAAPVICDPSCGSAGFLLAAADWLHQTQQVPFETILAERLTGFDVDPWAIAHASCLMELYQAQHGLPLPGVDLSFHCRDTLLSPAAELLLQAGQPDGFAMVVTNPPYVKLQNLPASYRQSLLARYGDRVQGSFSLALLALEANQELLAPEGCLGMITQNNLFTSLAAQKIRQRLQDRNALARVIDFGDARVFDQASTYTCLLFLDRRGRPHFDYAVADSADALVKLQPASFSQIKTAGLSARKWRLSHTDQAAHITAMEKTGRPLGEVAIIRVGFATLKDTVFFVREQGGQCVAEAQSEIYPIERDLTRPAVRVADINTPETVTGHQQRILFPYAWRDGRYSLIPEAEMAARFPQAYRYLKACRALLAVRDKGLKDYGGWYAWGRTQGMTAPGPKLLTKTFNRQPQFFYDPSDQLFCNGYAVSLPPDSPLSLMALARLLNSRTMHYYARLTSVALAGGYQCYQKNFIEKFGIPDMDREQQEYLLGLETEAAEAYIAGLYGLPYDDLCTACNTPATTARGH